MKLRLKKSVKSILQVLLIVVLILLCILFLKSRVTYTSYESKLNSDIAAPIATWKILIDGKNITTDRENDVVKIDNIVWDQTNVREGKVAPGSEGKMTINIDPSGTRVAVYYEMEFIDKSVDETKLLKISNMSVDSSLRKIDVNKYAGIFTLDDIKAGVKPVITMDVVWVDDEDLVWDEDMISDLDSFVVFNFSAKQYFGEELPPIYTE